jgi:hypothetical protein
VYAIAALVHELTANDPSSQILMSFAHSNLQRQSTTHNDVKVVLTKEAFESIPVSTADDFPQDTQCTVCVNNYKSGDQVIYIPKCQHLFHMECAKHWLTKYKRSCPNCRTKVEGETCILEE